MEAVVAAIGAQCDLRRAHRSAGRRKTPGVLLPSQGGRRAVIKKPAARCHKPIGQPVCEPHRIDAAPARVEHGSGIAHCSGECGDASGVQNRKILPKGPPFLDHRRQAS